VNLSVPRQFIIRLLILTLVLALIPASALAASNETVDLDVIGQIRSEGYHNSQVMQLLSELTDRIGPRLTGSPSLKLANDWTRDKLAEFGLVNAHLEGYDFGRGWTNEFTSVRMMSPETTMLIAIPRAWSPGTNGAVRGKAIRVSIKSKEDMEKYRGKLSGMIVLNGDAKEVKPHTDPEAVRYTDQKLDEIAQFSIASRYGPPMTREEMIKAFQLRREVSKFYADEKVLAVIEPSNYDLGLVTMSGLEYKKDANNPYPVLNMVTEHYGRISRLLERNVPVELELNVQTKFIDDDNKAYNTIAEFPGTDKKLADEVIMIGGHLDSWHGGTGATDNATGVVAAMEAVRILKALDLKPRRTIRIALWSGEEQGLLGSRAYVAEHLASRPESTDPKEKDLPSYMRTSKPGPLTFKPEYKKVVAYFNLDNGGGKLRGIYTQENSSVAPIFAAWIEPLKDLGCATITQRNTGSTDHVSFDAVGVPGFQFIQDPLDYMSRTHHSNMDVYERVQSEDLIQQAVVLASFAYNAAMRDLPLPRKTLPKDALPKPEAAPTTTAKSASK
jgi:carboxypeptidase Q